MSAKKTIVIITVFLLQVLFVVFGLSYVHKKVFYSPDNDIHAAVTTFVTTSQLLSPYTMFSDLNASNPFHLFKNSHTFYMRKQSYINDEARVAVEGKLVTSFGKTQLESYQDHLKLGKLTISQQIFVDSGQARITPEWDRYKADDFYNVWFRFRKPLNAQQVYQTYETILYNNQSRRMQSGVIWIPVRTSDQKEDVCLGMAGNDSLHYLNSELKSFKSYLGDSYEAEDYLWQSIKYLIDHPKDTKALINSGLYPGCETLDFSARLSYIEENGITCLGMVAYLRGDVLKSLQSDENLEIVKLEQDVPLH